ncbi:MAG: TetR/AcrR family transcriptional regulator [Porphyromonadaceae bacterium]|nr:TetR/AcrR family transcriptional regulator [Porphyromonadaceae bacterium]
MLEKISKTKQQLIDVARELFGSTGKTNVTMNEIAEASNKGRRTLYTYFKNKDEVYRAVVENELKLVIESLKANAKQDVDSYTKLKGHILTHLDSVKETVTRNGTLRADFFRDIYEVERSRRKMDIIELGLIKDILREGISKREFINLDVEAISVIILYSLKGLEIPYIRESFSTEFEENKNKILDFIFSGMKQPL